VSDTASEYISTREAARRLAVSKSFLEKVRLKGGGPRFVKVGKVVRYQIADLNAWTSARAFESTAQYVRRCVVGRV
jgi:excisionase family DNA binding protein